MKNETQQPAPASSSGPAQSLHELFAQQARQLDALVQVSQALASAPSLEALLQLVVHEARQLLDGRLCTILLVGDGEENLEVRAISGERSEKFVHAPIPIQTSITGRAVIQRETIEVPDVQQEPLYQQRDFATEHGLRGLVVVPIMLPEDVMGALNFYLQEGQTLDSQQRVLLAAFAGQAAVAIASARRFERIVETEGLLRQSERMALLGMISAELAHEVRNPMTAIDMMLHALAEEPEMPGRLRGDLDFVIGKLKDIDAIMTRTLNLAKAPEAPSGTVNVAHIVDDVLRLLEHRFIKSGVFIQRDYVSAMPAVLADRGQVQQVLLNLLLNAVRVLGAADQSEKIIRISLHETRRDGQAGVEAQVRDNGPGLPPELIEKPFEPLQNSGAQQGAKVRSSGTGLGLYISQKIVAKHLGIMRLWNNEDGPGCTVSFWLPMHIAEQEDRSSI